jgi:ribosome-binding protein aMBF1 (putative translation factor)
MKIGELRNRRKSAQVSQYDLAAAIRKSQFYVSGCERGIFTPSPEMLEKMEVAIKRLAERRQAIERASAAIAAEFPTIKDVSADL